MSVPTAELTAPTRDPGAWARAGGLSDRLAGVRGGRVYLVAGGIALLIAVFSLLIPSTPSYDPWAWLVWGREVVHLNLHTTGGPSWKPLPMIFTTLFAPFGGAAPDMWLVISRAGAVMAVVMVFKLTARFTRQLISGSGAGAANGPSILAPTVLAGVLAAASFALSRGFISDNGLGYSEGLMTALVLIAIDRHLDGACRQAFIVGFGAALDRPELWLFWGPYGLYLWWTDPGARKLVAALFVLIPALWFLPELWGSGHLFRGVQRASHPRSNSAAFASCPLCTEFTQHAWGAILERVKAVAVVTMAVAGVGLWRSRRTWWRGLRARAALESSDRARAAVLLTGALGFLWWFGISVETQLGFSGNDRYLVLGAALVTIAGSIGWGWFAFGVARLVRRIAASGPFRSLIGTGADEHRRLVDRVSSWSVAVGAGALFIAIPPWLGAKLPATHRALVYQARLRQDMSKLVTQLGRSNILRCGPVMTEGFQVPMLAWNLHVHTLVIEASPPSYAARGLPPAVIFQTRAQRNASLLPHVYYWATQPGAHYKLVAHDRTFRVFANCQGRVTL